MALALVVLAFGSVVAGYVGLPHALGGSNRFEQFLAPSLGSAGSELEGQSPPPGEAPVEAAHDSTGTELSLMAVSSAVALGGIWIASLLFLKRPDVAGRLAGRYEGVKRLLLNKYYVDEIYDAVIVQPVRIISEHGLWKVVDARLIDGAVNGVGAAVGASSGLLRRIQSGSVRVYAAALFLGLVLVLGYSLWS